MSEDKLYIKPVGGLCNRLRAIGSASVIASQTGKKLVVFWGRDEHLNCKFSSLFMPSTHYDVLEEKQWLNKKALYPYLPGSKPTSVFRKSANWLTCQILGIQHQVWYEDFNNTVSTLVGEVNPTTIESMRAFEMSSFEHLQQLIKPIYTSGSSFICTAWKLVPWENYKEFFVPIPQLQDIINKTSQNFYHTIGVHIRRKDHDIAIRYSAESAFITAMQHELNKDYKVDFYLSTDCLQTERKVADRFTGKVQFYTKKSYDRNSQQGIQEALIDLFVLANTKKLLGSYCSSYSQVAAEISGIQEETIL